MPSRNMSSELAILEQWAHFGKLYVSRPISEPKWSAINQLVIAATPYLREKATTLKDLLAEWSRKFGMQDPFLNDLGVHRWIARETSYSDWLAWVLERLEPSAVFQVLDVKPPFNPEHAGKCLVRRESLLDERYIDLLIRFENAPDYAIGVEVKTYDEQYAKQEDYVESLKSIYREDIPCILLAIPEHIDKKRLCGFRLRSWRKVALALRMGIAESVTDHPADNQIVTAILLGFVSAVEQNLLGFGPEAPRRVLRNEPTLISEDLVKYLGGDR